MNIWRERLQRWLGPVARRCPLSPNAITLLALAINVVGAACFALGPRDARLFPAGIVLVAIGGLADALDGLVARERNASSRFGDFLDHAADRLSDTLVAAGWLIGNRVAQPLLIAVIIAVMLNGYLGTQIEATWHERRYDSMGRGEFVLGLIVAPIASYILMTNGWESMRFARLTVAEWIAVAMLLVAVIGTVQRFSLARRLEEK